MEKILNLSILETLFRWDKSRDIFKEAPDDGNWTSATKAFYSKGVIKDIITRQGKKA